MIKKITISYINRANKTSKAGKPYESVSIKAMEYGDRFINGFGGKWNKEWKTGDEVNLEITEKDWEGKKYLNFSEIDNTAMILDRLNSLEKVVEDLKDTVEKFKESMKPIYLEWKRSNTKVKVADTEIDYPEMEKEPEFDIPDNF